MVWDSRRRTLISSALGGAIAQLSVLDCRIQCCGRKVTGELKDSKSILKDRARSTRVGLLYPFGIDRGYANAKIKKWLADRGETNLNNLKSHHGVLPRYRSVRQFKKIDLREGHRRHLPHFMPKVILRTQMTFKRYVATLPHICLSSFGGVRLINLPYCGARTICKDDIDAWSQIIYRQGLACEDDKNLKARSVVQGKDRVQMNWRLVIQTVKLKALGLEEYCSVLPFLRLSRLA